jgi:hypothetical protein
VGREQDREFRVVPGDHLIVFELVGDAVELRAHEAEVV